MASASCWANDSSCEEPGDPKGDTNTAAAEGKVGDPGKEPAVCFSGFRASAHLTSEAGGRGVAEGTVRSGLIHRGCTDTSLLHRGALLVLCLHSKCGVSDFGKGRGHGRC